MADDLSSFLLTHGPQLSSSVAAALIQTHGITAAAARKRIERRDTTIRALNLQFPRNAQFLYLEGQYGSSRFWKQLATALEDSNGAYARTIWALSARGGLIPSAHFTSAVGASRGQRQISGEDLIARLGDIGLLQELEVPGLGRCIAFAKGETFLDALVPQIRARLITENVLLQSVQTWAAKLGLGSFHSFKLRGDASGGTPTVANFDWDLSAPSFLGPLATWTDAAKPKPGFLTADVLFSENVNANDIRPFIYKCSSLRQLRGVGRCLHFFIAHHYTKEALDMIRRAGIVPATPESLFGEEVAEALLQLSKTLSEAATHTVDPEKFSQLFERLGKVEGAAGTLRGALFEFIVAAVVRKTLPDVIVTMNKIYREGGKDAAEVDVHAVIQDREVRFIECKGLLPGHRLSDQEVQRWLTKRIPLIRKKTLENPDLQRLKLKFELWLTGELSPESQALISAAQQTIDSARYSIEVIQADELQRRVQQTNDASLKKVVKQHFLQHPLAVDDTAGRQGATRHRRPSEFDLTPDAGASASPDKKIDLPAPA